MNGSHVYIPNLSSTNKVILLVAGGFFLFQSILFKVTGFSLPFYLGLSVPMVLGGYIYQIFTYPLVQAGLINFIFNALVIWFIGSDLESLWGRRRYLAFVTSVFLVAGFCYFIIALFFSFNFHLMGITGLSYGLLLAYAVLFPNRILTFMLIFPMRAKNFCLILMGILLFGGLLAGDYTSWGHLGAMLGAYGFMYTAAFWRQNQFSLGNILKNPSKRAQKKRHLRLIKTERDPKKWH